VPTLFLFDVDGTLIHAGGAGRRAVRRAFGARFFRPEAVDHLSFAGATDRAIAREGFTRLGLPTSDEHLDAFFAAYLDALAEEIATAPGYRVMPGAAEAVAFAASLEGAAVGLGTGNLERGARIKLARGGLNEHFTFGGFGSDHEERAELLRIGWERGARWLGVAPGACRVVVIGDTLKDIEAARAIGAVCIAVANGFGAPEELREASPDYWLASLEGAEALEALEAASKNGTSAGSTARASASSAPS